MEVTRVGGKLGIPGLYVIGDPGAVDDDAKVGTLKVRLEQDGLSAYVWYRTNACYKIPSGFDDGYLKRKSTNREGTKAVIATLISLDQIPAAYAEFDQGASKKFVTDPHGLVRK